MLIGILSDIHGNLEAFRAVLHDMDNRRPDRVVGLGDLIGYGPDPDEVVSIFRKRGYVSVCGNHEAALHDTRMRNWLNFQARENSLGTEKLLSPKNHDFCCAMPQNMCEENALFVHGFPPSSLVRYVTRTSDGDLEAYFRRTDCDICFVGHTHDLQLICWDGRRLKREALNRDRYQLRRDHKYIVNAGSVGQPRDGTSTAKYMLWEAKNHCLEIIGIAYDYRTTAQKIKERGFPEIYGLRLG